MGFWGATMIEGPLRTEVSQFVAQMSYVDLGAAQNLPCSLRTRWIIKQFTSHA